MSEINSIETVNVVQLKDGLFSGCQDVVVAETPLTIFVNDQELVTLLCSPTHLQNLAVGFLYSENILSSKEEIEALILNKNKGVVWVRLNKELTIDDNFRKSRTVTSGCARGLTFFKALSDWKGEYLNSELTISADIVFGIAEKLKTSSLLFQRTGGVHTAILCQQANFLMAREDIGRHNAVDKIIGECVLKGIGGSDKIIMTSGRISSEILLKTARWKIPIVISRGAPTLLAVKLADELGVTLIGFARGRRMNIYSNSWRIENLGNKWPSIKTGETAWK